MTWLPLFAASGLAQTESLIFQVLVQLLVIVAAARLGGWLFTYLGQPQVVGEIAAGLLLGPSCFARLAPDLAASIFPTGDLARIFKVLSEIGLVWLMFLIGQEFEFGHLRQMGRAAVAVSVAGVVLPFGLGLAVGTVMYPHVAVPPHVPEALSRSGFLLFMAVALSITAIPILGRIMIEFQLTRTRLGALTITAAAVDDATGWILLAAISAVVQGNFEPGTVLWMLGLTVAFVLCVWWVARPALKAMFRGAYVGGQLELSASHLAVLLVAILASAIATNLIGIFSIFGPFVLGAALWDVPGLREAITVRLRDFVFAFFLPIFFTYTGLRTNVGLLDTPRLWLFCGLVLAAAVLGKTLGCGLLARWFGGLSWRESGCVAVMMNTRALMELIVINLGRELGVIPDSVFCMLVLMALVTTFMTSPLLRPLLRGVELGPNVV